MSKLFDIKYLNFILGTIIAISIYIIIINLFSFIDIRKNIADKIGNKEIVSKLKDIDSRLNKINRSSLGDMQFIKLYDDIKSCANSIKSVQKNYNHSLKLKSYLDAIYSINSNDCIAIYYNLKIIATDENNTILSKSLDIMKSSLLAALVLPNESFNHSIYSSSNYIIKDNLTYSMYTPSSLNDLAITTEMSIFTNVSDWALEYLYEKAGLNNE